MPSRTSIFFLSAIPALSSCIFVAHDEPFVTTEGKVIMPSGRERRVQRILPPVRRIVSPGPIDVSVRIGSPQPVTVVTDDNLTSWVSTSVSKDVLTIDWDAPRVKSGSMSFHAPRVEIVVASLDVLTVEGVGDAHVDGLSGGTLAIEIAGSGSVDAKGRVDGLQVRASGFGDANLYTLESGSAEVTVTGNGNVEIYVRDRLRANVSGNGDVRYHGHPSEVSKSVTGAGSIEADEN
jgi:hypothetical protein